MTDRTPYAHPQYAAAPVDPVAYADAYQSAIPEPHRDSVFWLHPLFLLLCTLGIPTLATLYLTEETFVAEWHCHKYFTSSDGQLIAWLIALFAAGNVAFFFVRQWLAHSGYRLSSTTGFVNYEKRVRQAFWFSAFLCLVGSAVWTLYSIRQGVSLSEARSALSGNSAAVLSIRAKAETIPGITTLTQLGMAAATLAGLAWFHPRAAAIRLTMIAIIVVALLRGFLRAERLAFIEVCVPFFVSLLPELINRHRHSRLFRWSLILIPFIAVSALMGFFILAESGRSYEAKVEEGNQHTAVEYGAIRLGGYYGTSLNNGAYLARHLPPGRFPHFTFEWFWRFPGVRLLFNPEDVTGVSARQALDLVTADLNPEFNNTSGIFMYVHDFRRAGSLPMAFIAGFFAAALFFSYRSQSTSGRLLYPLLVVGFLEIARIPYLTHTRTFPSVVFLVALVVVNQLSRSKRLAAAYPVYQPRMT